MTTDHDQFVAYRVREIETFEARARGEIKHTAKRRPPTAQSATQGTEISTMSTMSLFQPAASTSAYLKMGVMGKQGAGKSMTAGLLAIGIAKHLKALGLPYAGKPVAYFDTEKGSDWLIPVFEKEGIPLMVAKKRAFADLVAAMKWAEENASVLIIDSITHPWRELQESYMKKKQRSFLQIDDWSYLKGPHGWQQFTDAYINSKLHIIMAGRAGDETEQYVDDNGKRQFEKVGVKMKTETDTGFEPDLLVLMEREMDLRTKQVAHVARVVKDRSMLLDGKDFTFASYDLEGNSLPVPVLVKQTFGAFLPHINCLNLGGAHIGVNTAGDSTSILKTEKRDWSPVQRKIVLGEIQDLMVMHIPG
ncbi:MAG: AAA family ATPase, partial [Bradyrhizobium sp.]|nr:AAA family ATPase [Bradyrhizobium sp.]